MRLSLQPPTVTTLAIKTCRPTGVGAGPARHGERAPAEGGGGVEIAEGLLGRTVDAHELDVHARAARVGLGLGPGFGLGLGLGRGLKLG